MENKKVTIKSNIPVITERTTLDELIAILGPVTKARSTPNSKVLRENAGNPIVSVDRCVVYRNGYAVYDNDTGRTVVWVPDCSSFTYHFNKRKDSEQGNDIAESFVFSNETLKSLPWVIAITLIGEHRIEKLAMRRKGDRKENKSLIRGDNEEGDAMDELKGQENSFALEYFWREPQIGEDPETIYIHREAQMELLERMTSAQREAFVLYYQYGYTQYEIADILGISQNAVKCRLQGAVARMKYFHSFF